MQSKYCWQLKIASNPTHCWRRYLCRSKAYKHYTWLNNRIDWEINHTDPLRYPFPLHIYTRPTISPPFENITLIKKKICFRAMKLLPILTRIECHQILISHQPRTSSHIVCCTLDILLSCHVRKHAFFELFGILCIIFKLSVVVVVVSHETLYMSYVRLA